MTSRLVLVIGDLHIPDRALDIPAKVGVKWLSLSFLFLSYPQSCLTQSLTVGRLAKHN
jgi:hypothetical protein